MGSVWLCDVHQLPMLPDVLLNSILGKAESNLLRLSLEGLLRLFPPQDFDIKEDLQKPIEKSAVPQVELLREEAAEVWDEFRKLPDGARY